MQKLNHIIDCIDDLILYESALLLISIIFIVPEDLRLYFLGILCIGYIILLYLFNKARKDALKGKKKPESEKCVGYYEFIFRFSPLALFLLLFFFLTISVFGQSLNTIFPIILWFFVFFTTAEIVSYLGFNNDLSNKRLLTGILFIFFENFLLLLFFIFTDVISKSEEEKIIIGKFLMPIAFLAIQSLLFYFHSTVKALKEHLFRLKEWIGFPS